MATMLNNTYHQSKESNESNPAIPEVAYQRTSVIKSMHSLKRKSPDQLQNEAYMLRQQGSILQHTGIIQYQNYHYHLLLQEIYSTIMQTFLSEKEVKIKQLFVRLSQVQEGSNKT